MSEDDKKYYQALAVHYAGEAKMHDCIAMVLVESYDDSVFWDKIFKYFIPEYPFDYIYSTKTPKGDTITGCTACLKYFESECLSKDFFICIDSDYRLLLQETNKDVEHFVFQTYTHSIENHYCYFKNLENVFDSSGYKCFNPHSFLKKYSKTLYHWFIFSLISETKKDGLFPLSKFKPYIGVSNLNEGEIIKNLKKQIENIVNPYEIKEVRKTRRKCSKLGLNSKNAYLYFRGHDVDKMIETILNQLCREINKKCSPIKDIHFDRYLEINKIKADTVKYKQLHAN
ncbi:MAG: DUF4435 domain-containing protein [Candidatus Symbiothrix sp.]|jgi:hypothetical protein|nr:DUF4435 domain-containing protein [Candidatus Symbiothrix sp.]